MEKNEKRNDVTELVFILDRSGSMGGLESDTIGGFNAMLSRQKEKEGKVFVSTVLFDDRTEVLHDRLPLETIEPLTEKDYYVRGSTALIDAIGGAIKHISTIHKYARPEDVPASTMFVIMTDGYENASHKYSSDEVKKAIEQKKTENGWEFLFIGANIDAVETAKHFGIGKERAVNYHADKKGTAVAYAAVSNAVSCVRSRAPLSEDCLASVNEDYQSRKKKLFRR